MGSQNLFSIYPPTAKSLHPKPLCSLPFYSPNICLLSFDFYETGVGKFSRAVEISFPL